MTKEDKIKKIQEAIEKLEKGIVKVSERSSQKKKDSSVSSAFDRRFSKYGPFPFAAALLEAETPEISGPFGGYYGMIMKSGQCILTLATAVAETPLLLGRSVVALGNSFAYKIGNIKIDKANEKLNKLMAKLEEKRGVLDELFALDNAEMKLAAKEADDTELE